MICIGTGNLVIDENRMHYSPEVYFKTAEQMREIFADVPGACDATLEIAERCNVSIKLDSTSSEKYPQFGTPDGSPREEYLMKVCRDGLVKRYGEEKAESEEIADPPEIRGGHHQPVRLRLLLPHHRRLHPVGARQRHPGRPRPGIGGGLAGVLRHGHHRHLPDAIRPVVRTIPQPGTCQPARRRYRLLPEPPRRGHRLRAEKIRRAQRFAHHHLRQAGREERAARRLPRDGNFLRRGRPHRQDDRGETRHQTQGRV